MRYNAILIDNDTFRANQYADELNLLHIRTTVTDSIKNLFKLTKEKKFDVFILDIHMDDYENILDVMESDRGYRTGLALLYRLRDMCPDAKIVALTNMNAPHIEAAFTNDDSVDYFLKDDYPPKKFAQELYNSLEKYYYYYESQNDIDFNTSEICIFLSYCWNDSKIADNIDNHLRQLGIKVKRDIRDIVAWGSIKNFMESIRLQDYAILIISDDYLKSTNCMFEVSEIIKDAKYENKIFPVILEKSIYKPIDRISYISYWENEAKKLEQALSAINIANSAELAMELRRVNQVQTTISTFLDKISDLNNPRIDDVIVAIVNKIGVHKS